MFKWLLNVCSERARSCEEIHERFWRYALEDEAAEEEEIAEAAKHIISRNPAFFTGDDWQRLERILSDRLYRQLRVHEARVRALRF